MNKCVKFERRNFDKNETYEVKTIEILTGFKATNFRVNYVDLLQEIIKNDEELLKLCIK